MNDDEKARIAVILDEQLEEMEEMLDDIKTELMRFQEYIEGVEKTTKQNIDIVKEQLGISGV